VIAAKKGAQKFSKYTKRFPSLIQAVEGAKLKPHLKWEKATVGRTK
jgi:hypothetical protein